MNAERIDFLTTQYAWAIQSNGRWNLRLREAVTQCNFAKFRRHVGTAVNDLRHAELAEEYGEFSEPDRVFLVLLLWEQEGGHSGDMSNDHLYYVGEAARYGISYNFTGKKVPQTNPCGEIPLREKFALDRFAPSNPLDLVYSSASYYPNINSAQTGQKDNNMNTAIAFATKHFVYGQDVSTMTEGELINAIKKIESEVSNLEAVKTSSTKIASKIAELKAMLDSIVKALDAK